MSDSNLVEIEKHLDEIGLDRGALTLIVAEALDEDLGGRGVLPGAGAGVDVTSVATIPADNVARGEFIARQAGVLAGMPVAAFVVAVVCGPDGEMEIDIHRQDGATVVRGDVLMTVSGNARALLRAERVALNLLTLMSGVATATREWVDALAGTSTKIRDSRKTAPGLRATDKLAVRLGGGQNHRTGLFDMVLIKDNHIDFAGSITAAVRRVRNSGTTLEIEVETRSLDNVREALALGVERILLDNMSAETMREAVAICDGRAKLEASGNVTLDTVLEVARTGVDYISVGALTHSSQVFDVSLEFVA